MNAVNKFLLSFVFISSSNNWRKKKEPNKILTPYVPDFKLKRMALEAAYAWENLLLCAVCASHRHGLIEIGGDTCRASEITVWTSAINAGIPGTDSFLCQTAAGIWVHWIRLTVFNPPKQYLFELWSLQNIQVVVKPRQRLHKHKKQPALLKSSTIQKVSSPLPCKSECLNSLFFGSLHWIDNSHIALPISLKYLRSYKRRML